MKKYYTLEEAAQKLHLSPDQLRDMYKKKQIQAYPDRGTLQFPVKVVDEEARKRGLDSDPELQPSDAAQAPPRKGAAKTEDDDLLAVDFSIDEEVPLGREKASDGPRSGKSGKSSKKKIVPSSDSDVRLVLDSNAEFNIDLDSDVRLGESPRPKAKRGEDSNVRLQAPSDSDVKLDPKPASDSDIRLDKQRSGKKGKEAGIITEEIDLDAEEEKAQSTAQARKPKMTPQKPPLPATSPFELSEPDMAPPVKPKKAKKKAETDSSDDFEVISFDKEKASDIGSGEIPLLAEEDEVTLGEISAGKGNSGINLSDPADGGISLEGSDDEIEFELSLDSVATPKPAKNANKKAKVEDDSSSEFELSLDEDSSAESSSSEFELSLDDDSATDESGSDSEFELTLDDDGNLEEEDAKDIFEETNFDVPALDDDESGSAVVALDEGDTDLESSDSDFEISLEEDSASADDNDSGSQVVAIDGDEDDDQGATVAKKKPGKAQKPAKGGKPKAKALVESEEDIEIDDSGAELDLSLGESTPPKKRPTKKKKKPVAEVEGEGEEEGSDDEIETEEEQTGAPAPPAEWGPLPALLLFPTVVVMFVVGLMGFELVRGMWGYQKSTRVATPIVDTLSKVGK